MSSLLYSKGEKNLFVNFDFQNRQRYVDTCPV
jgi:hypothetical protein